MSGVYSGGTATWVEGIDYDSNERPEPTGPTVEVSRSNVPPSDHAFGACPLTWVLLGGAVRDASPAKIGLHAVAVLYTGGSLAQLLKLTYGFSWQEMPYIIDWAIVVLGTVGAITLALQTSRIMYRGFWEKPVHFLIIAHLTVSVALHLWAIYIQNHDLFAVFPYEYSYFAIAYFVFFAWRSWTVKLNAPRQSQNA